MKKSILAIAICATTLLIASGAPERPASNGETRITKQEFHWLLVQMRNTIVPKHPISCNTGEKTKADDKIYKKLRKDLESLYESLSSRENHRLGEMGMIIRLDLDQFDNSTIWKDNKHQLCVGKRYKFLETH